MDALNLDYIMGFILGFGAGFIVCAVIGIFHKCCNLKDMYYQKIW